MSTVKAYMFIALLMLSYAAPVANADSISVSLTVAPAQLYDQIYAYQNYTFHVAVKNMGVTVTPGEPVDPESGLLFTGRLVVTLSLQWIERGSYDFGSSTTGYTIKLDSMELGTAIALPSNGTESQAAFDHTFHKDAFDYGTKPYENIEVTVKAATFYEVYDPASPDEPLSGPKAGETSVVLKLLDEMKIDYVEGKLKDMADELGPLRSFPRPGQVNVDLYLGLLETMNASIRDGDYFAALATYKRYDEDRREDFISSLVREANLSSTRARQIQDLEQRVLQLEAALEQEMNRLQLELDQAQVRYAALSQTYQVKQAELEEAKQSLTTAITAVFLTSIAFFFLGRRSTTTNFFERGRKNQEVNNDDAAPGVR